ncbi:MAG: cyclodeaminase/cyclohydrolase family protein [Candidatus Omnitrophota bacterium]|nr:cyclodeaminase/cyclohydrolase family protein [Candidatus Omnitrophota bacterium]MBU1928886.1 cyclodeaminase/cyclohydrolase family protein [Candidatus Omnitrophota bacterium]MBU2034496.1 cyclodeaminase/cyclohydrolase family protein [Candidatus Omnitrophota bacterium]MBU2221328.1 cyclodeaminase/cyclohydrolase family protein [Candidatus Omnitrophota bacterium]MBU2257771.1 cyclodeaminase/cyclohydrolase family protein [Candidatus Omnitrophota bacterium]
MYKNKSLEKYVNDLAGKFSAPGGGSAACLVSCLGVSLLEMAVNFTLGKSAFAKYNKSLKKTLIACALLRKIFLGLLDADVSAYLNKDKDKSLKVPLKACEFSLKGMRLLPGLTLKINPALASDLVMAGILLEAGFTSAYYNVEINLKNIKDARKVKGIRKDLSGKIRLLRKIRQDLEAEGGKIIRR